MGFIDKLGETLKKFANPSIDVDLVRHKSKNIIGFYSPAENSGTTSLVCNIAEALQSSATPTVVVDLNFKTPTCYKYFLEKGEEVLDERSILNKIRNRSISAFEVISGSNNAFGFVSMSGYEQPIDYCELQDDIIESILLELASQFTYVLVDLGTDLNSDATIQGLLTCNKVYSVVRPINNQYLTLIQTKEIIENMGHFNKIKDVVQTMIYGNGFDANYFDEDGLHLVGNVAFDMDLMIAADNGKFVSAGKSKESARYLKLVKALADDIKHIIETTTIVTDEVSSINNDGNSQTGTTNFEEDIIDD